MLGGATARDRAALAAAAEARTRYNREIAAILRRRGGAEEVSRLNESFRRELFGAPAATALTEASGAVARALYTVTYTAAVGAARPRLGFCWNVAGPALMQLKRSHAGMRAPSALVAESV